MKYIPRRFFLCLAVVFMFGTSDRACAQNYNLMRDIYADMYMFNTNSQFNGFNWYSAWANLAGSIGLDPGLAGLTTRGQSDEAEKGEGGDFLSPQSSREFWGGFSYTYMKASGVNSDDGGSLVQSNGYRVSRPGFIGGIKQELDDTSSGGIIFVLAAPNFLQRGVYDYDNNLWRGGYRVDVDITDFQMAVHYEKKFWDNWELSLFLGGGTQWMNWHRTMKYDNDLEHYRGNLTGNTLTASVYLAKVVDLTTTIRMSKIIGIDSEHSWIKGSTESGEDHVGTYELNRWGCKNISYSRNTIRAGLRFMRENPYRQAGASFQIFYGYGIGDDAASVSIFRLHDDWEISDVKGLPTGHHSLTLGGNLHRYLDEAETLTLQMDYTAVLYKNLTTQNIAVSLAKRY